MKFKSILLTAAATISIATATMAQVPNYVPTNGLAGWWPFNGNANDESGNVNNGTVNGPTLSTDRSGLANSSYLFDGINDWINMPSGSSTSINITSNFTLTFWFKTSQATGAGLIGFGDNLNSNNGGYLSAIGNGTVNNPNGKLTSMTGNNWYTGSNQVIDNNWHFATVVLSNNTLTFLVDNSIDATFNNVNAPTSFNGLRAIGARNNGLAGYFNGKIDDIGIWNRALTQQEITDLYNAINCFVNTTISPQTNSITTGSTASFTATTSDPNPSYVWQSDLGQGYQTLNNFGNYSGANSATLNISNVQLSEHNQPIRVITTSGICIDTSNVAVISILDTCITNVTVYDTLLTTVTDTLVINTQITGINPPNNLNTLKVFPNPASTHITIDYGNFNAMSGYTLSIVNSVGQTVFTTPINQQTSYIDLSTWTGNGIYFVQLIDPQNNTIENRKIVIQ